MMKISHIISSVDIATGGPARSVTQLIQALIGKKEVSSLTLHTLRSDSPILKDFNDIKATIYFNKANFLGYSKSFNQSLKSSNADIFHGQGIWELPIHMMVKISLKRGIPYIISTRGALDSWSIQHKSLKKQIALKLYQRSDIRNAACLHATSNIEAKNIRSLGFNNPIAVIQNGIQLPQLNDEQSFSKTKSVLFLSRLVKNKGIEQLLLAWSGLHKSHQKEWTLVIVGEGELEYVSFLKKKSKRLGIPNIIFKGAIYGREKYQAFQQASLFVLPSYTENFGIVIAEALACGIPVITTTNTPWEDLHKYNCGWWINNTVKELSKTMEEALSLPGDQLIEMGKRGKELIETKYSMDKVAQQMLELYKWVLNGGSQPNFVI